MTAMPPPDPNEPPPPQRGLTREERGRDIGEAQAEAEAEPSAPKNLLKWMSPRFVLSQAEGYPVVIKQFLQFCLILVYPACVFAALFGLAVYEVVLLPGYYILLAMFWVLFRLLRMRQKNKNPEEYEAYEKNYWKRRTSGPLQAVQRRTGDGAVRGPAARERPPTAEAVHSSLAWFLEATLSYSKWTQGIEQVRRPIVVVNAP
jgi:hypothetical protein